MTNKLANAPSTNLSISQTDLDPSVQAAFKQTANAGLEHVSGSLPQLKVTESNSKNMLADGSRARAGTFYYSPNQESFSEVEVSLLAVSKGFYTLSTNTDGTPQLDEEGNKKTKFNQLVGGMIMSNMMPFVMFASGTRWPRLNEFTKLIKPLTRSKSFPIPMYALRVELSLEEVETKNGINNVVVYNLIRGEDDKIQIISEAGLVESLGRSVEVVKEMFDSFISRVEVDRETGEPLTQAEDEDLRQTTERVLVSTEANEPEVTDYKDDEYQDEPVATVNADDIPF